MKIKRKKKRKFCSGGRGPQCSGPGLSVPDDNIPADSLAPERAQITWMRVKDPVRTSEHAGWGRKAVKWPRAWEMRVEGKTTPWTCLHYPWKHQDQRLSHNAQVGFCRYDHHGAVAHASWRNWPNRPHIPRPWVLDRTQRGSDLERAPDHSRGPVSNGSRAQPISSPVTSDDFPGMLMLLVWGPCSVLAPVFPSSSRYPWGSADTQHLVLGAAFAWEICPNDQFSSIQLLSHVRLFAISWTAACQAAQSITNSQSLLKFMFMELVMASNYLILCPLAFNLFYWVSSSHQIAKVLRLQLQHQSFQWIFRVDFLKDWLVWSPCNPRDTQESSPTPQFKSINSSALNIPYCPTLISIHDYWKNYSFDLYGPLSAK